MTTPVLTVRGLRKTYRGRHGVTANDNIDLDVAAGRVDLAPHPALRDVTHAPGRLTATLDADDATAVVSMTSAAVGYAIALTLAPPIAMLLSQVLVLFVLFFSPIFFPRDRMPGWLATAHDWLPVEPMAQAVRAGLARSTFDMSGRSVVVLGAWCVAPIALAALALRRRS